MNTSKDPILFERREELKRQIAAGEYKSLLDVISDEVGRAIQRLTKSTQPLPFWYSATVIALLILIVDFLTSLVFGEFSAARYESIWAELSVSGVIVVGLTALRTYLDRVYATLRENILDSMDSAEDVADLEHWFASMAKVKQPLMFSVACTFLVNLPISLAGAALGGFISFGATMLYVGVGIGGGIFLALMDYHDRIMGARSLALDVRTGLNLLNSLLLPLLAFLVSNLRNVLALFLP